MGTSERLALAIHAAVARHRFDQARLETERLHPSSRRMHVALVVFQEHHGRPADLDRATDLADLQALAADPAAGEQVIREVAVVARLGDESVAAAEALALAWRDGTADVLEWIGCSVEEYDAALAAALGE